MNKYCGKSKALENFIFSISPVYKALKLSFKMCSVYFIIVKFAFFRTANFTRQKLRENLLP